jgi:hypothetical protein
MVWFTKPNCPVWLLLGTSHFLDSNLCTFPWALFCFTATFSRPFFVLCFTLSSA